MAFWIKKNIYAIRQNMKNRIRMFERKSNRQNRKKTVLEKPRGLTKTG